MCGIAGRVSGDAAGRVEVAPVERMCELMSHRGPDGRGVYDGGRAALGHVRLSIIDLAGGHQPLQGCTDQVWVTFNGEIYNYKLLRAELEAKQHVFRTRSDTEVLVHGWEEWGEALPSKLRGMFAFAIWDARKQVAFLARDRLGKKPLYVARAGRDLVFASEAKALFVHPDVRRELAEENLPAYLSLRYVPGPATLFRGVERLQPGHSLTFHGGNVTVQRFWEMPVEKNAPSEKLCEAEQVERFLQVFEESVRLRLMADVPVGVFLSGGLDSTAVTWAMRRHATGPVKSFSVGYAGDSEGELLYARLAARMLGTEHREVLITPEDFADFMPGLVWHLDEPVADPACVPLFYVAKQARREVVVVLSGEGADEVLGGYPIYHKQLLMEEARALGPAVDLATWPLMQALSRVKLPMAAKAEKFLRWAGMPLEERYLGVSRAFVSDAAVARALKQVRGPNGAERLRPYFEKSRGLSPLSRMLFNDVQVWLPDELLLKADKMTMATSIEMRCPFLDHELVEQCWALPDSLKLRGRVGKYLLRRAMAEKIPDAVLNRPKRGFPVPVGAWLKGPLHGRCAEALKARNGVVRQLFSEREVETLLDEHRRGLADRTQELFTLWAFDQWHQSFIGAGAATSELRAPAVPSLGEVPALDVG